MTTPLTSVIIAAKNAEQTIGSSLKSLTMQGFAPDELEVIVVNDGSEDHTADVIAEYENRLNLVPIDNPASLGVSASRNLALEASTGQTITYLDGDDWYAPGHLRKMTDAITGLGVDFVKIDYVLVEGTKRSLSQAPCAVRNRALNPRDYIMPANMPTMVDYPACWTGIFTRSMADRGLLTFDPALRTCEDRPWTWRQHLESDSFAVINSAGLCYRKGMSTSLTSIYDERQLDFIPAFWTVFAMLENDPEIDEFETKAVRNFLSILYHQLVRRSDQMTTEVKQKLLAGATTNVKMIKPELVERVVERFGDDRVPVIAPVLRRAQA